ncbi:hypothetical protein NUACC26_068960 [Scytonema sp. NUACC26]
MITQDEYTRTYATGTIGLGTAKACHQHKGRFQCLNLKRITILNTSARSGHLATKELA